MKQSLCVRSCTIFLATLAIFNGVWASPQISDSSGITRDALAIAPVETSPGIAAAVAANTAGTSLQRVEQAFETRLNASLAETRKFTIVARRNLDAILKEQTLSGSGFINTKDPQTAQMLKVAGVKWLAVPRVIDFEDVVRTRTFDGLDRVASRRSVRFTVVVDVLDTTTGVVGATAQVVATNSDLKDENLKALPQGSDPTEVVLDAVATIAAKDVACRILSVAYPAKMISAGSDMVNFNRGQGGCVSQGETWRVFRPGEMMVDPDTGEKLGSNDIEVGALTVAEILPAYTRGRMISGVAEVGDVLRLAPKDWTPSSSGSPSPSVGGSASSQPTTSAPVVSAQKPASNGGFSMAVIVQIVPGLPAAQAIPNAASDILQSMVIARSSALGIRVIAPQDVLQALKPGAAEEMIASDAAVTRLAKSVGADSVMVVTLTGKTKNTSTLTRNDTTTTVVNHQINGSWRLVNSTSGATVSGSTFSDQVAQMASTGGGESITISTDLLNRLLDDSAKSIEGGLENAMSSGMGKLDADAPTGWIAVNAAIDGITVPEIVKQDGAWRVVSGDLPVVFEADVSIDGLMVGTSPLTLPVTSGPHRLTVSRVGSDQWSKEIQVLDAPKSSPQSLRVSLRMTDEERARWLENAAIFQKLKIGSTLTEAQVNVMKGLATYLSQSGYRIDRRANEDVKVDTNQAPIIEQRNSFWNQPW
jgi:hypothetical protein